MEWRLLVSGWIMRRGYEFFIHHSSAATCRVDLELRAWSLHTLAGCFAAIGSRRLEVSTPYWVDRFAAESSQR